MSSEQVEMSSSSNISKKRIENELNRFNYDNESLRFTLGVLVMVFLCSFLIIIATFTQLNITSFYIPSEAFWHPITFFDDVHNPDFYFRPYKYIPQVPVIMFIAALLGRRFGTMSVIIYISAGLAGFPIFALGGGLKYILQYNFGYIVAFFPAVILAGSILAKQLSYKNIIKASVIGVLTIHIIGVLYTMIIAIIKGDTLNYLVEMVSVQSGFLKIFYDFVFSIFAIAVAKPAKKFLWIAMG